MMVVIVDMCGTLFRANTTRGLVELLRSRSIARWYSSVALSRVLSRAETLTHADLVRPLLIRALGGISRDVLYAEAREYVRRLVSTSMRDEVVEILNARRAKGALVCLATASLDPIAAAAHEYFGFSHVLSSQLEYRNGLCTGRLAFDSRGRKWKSLAAEFPQLTQADEVLAITDNPEDQDLRRLATEFHWVGQ